MPNLELAPLLLVVYTDEFKEIDYATQLNGPFEVSNTIQTLQQKAGAKGMGVMIQASVVLLDTIYGPAPEPQEKGTEDVTQS